MLEQLPLAQVREEGKITFPVRWSEDKLDLLRRTADRRLKANHPLDAQLAGALLRYSQGDTEGGEAVVLSAVRENASVLANDPNVFQRLIQATFVVQRLDLVAALLKERYSFHEELEIAVARTGSHPACVLWHVFPSGGYRFTFDAKVYDDDSTPHRIDQLQREFPLFAQYANYPGRECGQVLISQFDRGVSPGLAYCDSRPDFFLIPDCIFVPTRGYEYARRVFNENRTSWGERKPVAFWRGATTGPKAGPNQWRSLDRIKLSEIARSHARTGRIDCGISSVVQMQDNKAASSEIEAAGLFKDFVPWQRWGEYKYLIDIDGNSCTWSNLIQRFLTGSAVLKVESSRALIQWYYDDLIPWVNYIPIAPDMSDLMDKIEWLERHDRFAEEVGRRGEELARSLTYERELDRAMPVISAAFRYFRGESEKVAPFGWVAD